MALEMVLRTKQLVVGVGALVAAMVGGYLYCRGSGLLEMTSIYVEETLLQAAFHQDSFAQVGRWRQPQQLGVGQDV
jgi:hypothetical protein